MGRSARNAVWGAALGAIAVLTALASTSASGGRRAPAAEVLAPLPNELAGTGLYADWPSRAIAEGVRPFSPQYPLWTDGATKRRWIYLPPGATIDGTSADAWRFPVGTKLWKEFAFGAAVETRYMERTPRGWRFATYVHSDDGRTATLAPARGVTTTREVAPGVRHDVPSEGECRVCHGTGALDAPTPVLGFSAVQLSGDRDPGALHADPNPPGGLDLPALLAEARLRGYRGTATPRIAARTPTERAALGYLHGNCGGCHRSDGPLASVGMVLAASAVVTDPSEAAAVVTTVQRPSHFAPARARIEAGRPDQSVLVDRIRSRAPATQMPPLGTKVVDDEAVRLVTRWIEELPVGAR